MNNLRGGILMVLAMLGFAIEDMFIKLLAGSLSVGAILIFLGLGGALMFGALSLRRGDRLLSGDLLHPMVLLRNACEVLGTAGFVTAIALTPISSASAILQAIPLFVTAGAALFLGETVGWRRWVAILVGFSGVLLIIRPGMDDFQPASLFALQAAVFLAGRDLATRGVPATVSSMQLSTYAFAVIVPTGMIVLALTDQTLSVPHGSAIALVALTVITGVIAYYTIVAATRIGDVSYVSPFRYSRLIFALVIGTLVFGERPDIWVLTGSAIVVGSGLYTLLREAQRRRTFLRQPPLV
ncbi:DMT family transporter [Loktanella sp. SALINAS62]|uniref:DMT family transporter n=1 Tax=Loktanella sp. SALINAS62 TaxID=2706124 RepID=UPI001B8AF300|nr:DMT family transporter [Loktanella sp. SALINAS62]MBS1303717.1 DMT family transporter [Loktanella sp. SALINAS62]